MLVVDASIVPYIVLMVHRPADLFIIFFKHKKKDAAILYEKERTLHWNNIVSQ